MKTLRRTAALTLVTTGAVLAGLLTPVGSTAATAPLASPNLVGPADSGSVIVKSPVLKWTAMAGAATYEVQVSPSEDWADPANVPLDETVVSTQFAPSILLPHASYFWRVRAIDKSSVKGTWSDAGAKRAWTFTNGWYAAPAPVYPSGAVGAVSDIRFSWQPVLDASFYEVQLSRDAAFPDPTPLQSNNNGATYTCLTTNTTMTPLQSTVEGNATGPGDCVTPGDFGQGQWFWRVRAHDGTADTFGEVSTTPAASGLDHDAPVIGSSKVTSISPTFGPAGTAITLNGSSLDGAVAVWFGKQRVILLPGAVSGDGKAITVAAPSGGTGTVYVTVEFGDGTKTSENPKATFTFGTAADATPPKGAVTPAPGEQSLWSPTVPYSADVPLGSGGLLDQMHVTGLAVRPNGRNGVLRDACTPDAVLGTTVCATTPTLLWDANPGAAVYRITIGLDAAFTNVQRRYETLTPSVTPTEVLPDNQAGQAYWVAVQPCTLDGCGFATVTSFKKRGARTILAGPTGYVTQQQVELTWAPIFNQGDGFEPKSYHVQVASDDEFNTIVDQAVVDRTSYVSDKLTYPDSRYFWRVQGIDQSGHAMAWSAPNRDVDIPATFTKDTVAPVAKVKALSKLDKPISLTWSEAVVGGTVSVKVAGGSSVAGVARKSGLTWTFTPRSPWVAGQSYVVSVAGATDLAGNAPATSSLAVRATTKVESSSGALRKTAGDMRWKTVTASDASGKTFVRSSDKTSTKRKSQVSTKVKGRYITVWACKSPRSGDAALVVDGKRVTVLKLYRKFSGCGVVYKGHKALANKVHTVTVMAGGHKSRKSKGYAISVDAIGVR